MTGECKAQSICDASKGYRSGKVDLSSLNILYKSHREVVPPFHGLRESEGPRDLFTYEIRENEIGLRAFPIGVSVILCSPVPTK